MEARLSIWSQYYHDLRIEDAVLEFIKNGIFCSELSDEHGAELLSRSEDFVATGKAFGDFLRKNNFEMSQGHLWLRARICSDESAIEKLYSWIDMYEAIGIKNMVLHCDRLVGAGLSRKERFERNVERLRVLAEYIKDKDITVCLENLRSPDEPLDNLVVGSAADILEIIRAVGSERFGICLDTGHLNLTYKDQRDFILTAADKLRALHIADNEGERDQHLMPFTKGKVDFGTVVDALREINYVGLFNLEIPGETKIPLELRNEKIKYIKACYSYLMKH